jgi:peroxiredoxin
MVYVDADVMSFMTTQTGETLLDLSQEHPILLVFLRHFGCQFCRQAMDELSKQRQKQAGRGVELIFVHMAENKVADEYFRKFNLSGVKHISDIECRYYSTFGLVKGTFTQLFGLKTWIRGFKAQATYGNDMGAHLGDSFQMPGAFMIFKGEIRGSYVHKHAADQPDYDKLMQTCVIQ